MKARSGVAFWAAGQIGGRLVDALMRTVRFEVENDAAWKSVVAGGRPVLFMPWHGRLLPLSWLHRRQGIAALVSQSADGEYIARVLQQWGFHAVRGSSSRGGDVALRELIRTVRGGRSAAITPDGPRGPKERVKPGILQLAQLSGAPIIPMAGAADRAWWIESWDRFLVPRPFARMKVVYGHPFPVARDTPADALPALAAELEARMAELMRRAEVRG